MKKTNKLISILLVLAMLLSMAPLSLTASAASEAITLKKNSYTKVDYSNSATQYYQYNNYLYKVAYSNLKNISEVAIEYNRYDYLILDYTESDTGGAAWVYLLTSYRGSTAELSNLPTVPGKSVSFYTSNTTASNEKKPVVTVTCMAVNEPVWSWNGVSSATAVFTSTDGGATMTVDAAIEISEKTAENCLETDTTAYTATATANGKEYTNVKTIYGEQGPHSFEYSGDDVIGSCTNGCGYECPHENQTGEICEICGADIHLCSYTNGFCTECDAYEPAELNESGYYEIGNAGQLFWFANHINTVDRTANAVLVADIDLENRPWTPIGSTGENSNNFRGVFDGQNYTIRGLYVEGGRAGLGFFGEVRTGTVKNFTIYGEVVANTEVNYVGGVIGSACGLNSTDHGLERNGAIIQNITSYVNLTAKTHGIGMIGGFVGYANHQSLIENCSWYGTFDAGVYRVDSGAGGFIGKIQENTSEVTIRNCGAYGTIKTNYAGDYNNTATIYMGGFLSFSNTGAGTVLENCLFAGKFERGENLTDQAFLGAFGTLRSVNSIKNCYYLGDDGLAAVHSDSNLKPGENIEITSVTDEQLKSGEIAYLLQEANEVWGQKIGTDDYPVLGGETVYYGYVSCADDAVTVYTNDSTASDKKPAHNWSDKDGICANGCSERAFNAINGMTADGEKRILSGIAPGSESLDGYTEILIDGIGWTLENGVGTGCTATLGTENEIVAEYVILIYGDVNGDGWYDGQDAVIVSCLANGMLTQNDVSEAVYTAADCNHDGVIDQFDVDLLNQAGTLLANVDQTKPSEVLLETSSEYVEYLGLIDQAPEADTDNATQQDAELDIFGMIIDFIKLIVETILSYIPMLLE